MGCGQISQRAALWDGPYEPQTHFPTSYEPLTTNNKKALAVVPPIQPNPGYLCLAVYFHTIRVTRFGISDSHGFARRKAPLLTMHYVYITFQAGRPTRSAPTNHKLIPHEPRTTNNKKSTGIFQCFFTRISGFLSSQGASPQVLSAFAGLTAVFGMGTGGSPQLSPLNYIVQDVRILTTA